MVDPIATDPPAPPRGIAELERLLAERTRELALERQRAATLRGLESSLAAARFGAVLLADAGGWVTFANEAAAQRLGRPRAALAGTALAELVDGGLAPLRSAVLGGAGPLDPQALAFARPDGARVAQQGVVAALGFEEGEPTGYLLVTVDAGERLAAECARHEDEKLAALARLADCLAHEINTPLQFVGDSVGFLRDAYHERVEPGADVAFLDRSVLSSAERALAGLERIRKAIDAARATTRGAGEAKAPIDVNAVVRGVAELARRVWEPVATLELELAPSLPRLMAHAAEVADAVQQLVVNAAEAIAALPGSGARGRIVLRTRRVGSVLEIAVADTGRGMAPAERARLFEPFFTTKAFGSGGGHGCAIVHHVVVRRHRGEVRCTSAPGEGTTFILRFPLAAELRG